MPSLTNVTKTKWMLKGCNGHHQLEMHQYREKREWQNDSYKLVLMIRLILSIIHLLDSNHRETEKNRDISNTIGVG